MKRIITFLFLLSTGCVQAQTPAQNVQVNPQTGVISNMGVTSLGVPNGIVTGSTIQSKQGATTYTYTWPPASGVLGLTAAAGSDTWVQYNHAGAFGANSGFFTDTSGNVGVHTLQINGSGAITYSGGLLSTGGGSNFESNDFISNTGAFRGTGNTHLSSPGATTIASTIGTFLSDLTSNGLVKTTTSNGKVATAVPGTDYAAPTVGTSILYGNGAGGFSNVTIGTNLSFSGGTLNATGGGGGSPAGSSTWVQYNSSGSFGANSGFTSDSAGNVAVLSLQINGSGAITYNSGTGLLSTGGGSNFSSNDFISNTGVFKGTGNTHLTSPGATTIASTSGTFLSDFASNGFVKTTGGAGQLTIDTSAYITGNQTITLGGDTSGAGATSITVTVSKVHGVSYGTSPSTNTVPVVTGSNTVNYETVPVAAGGTNATSVAVANQNLTPGVISVTETTGAATIDFSLGRVFDLTLTANCTITLSSPVDGQTVVIFIHQTGANTFTVTWPSMGWPNGTPPTQTTGTKTDRYEITYNGVIPRYYGFFNQAYSP